MYELHELGCPHFSPVLGSFSHYFFKQTFAPFSLRPTSGTPIIQDFFFFFGIVYVGFLQTFHSVFLVLLLLNSVKRSAFYLTDSLFYSIQYDINTYDVDVFSITFFIPLHILQFQNFCFVVVNDFCLLDKLILLIFFLLS